MAHILRVYQPISAMGLPARDSACPLRHFAAALADRTVSFMRRIFPILFCFVAAATTHAATTVAGRWQGSVQIPGNEFEAIVDLAQDTAGTWTGSMIAPSLNIKDAALTDIVVSDSELAFTVQNALGGPPAGQAKFKARIDANGGMSGDFTQAGNTAPFALKRAGPAQVALPPHSTSVAKAIEGKWVGDYELGGYPRHVILDLTNHAGAAATAEVVIIGKKTTRLPVNLVTEEENFLRIEANEIGIVFEGRFNAASGDIKGNLQQGPFEPVLVLHRIN
jgi:hypothetical protein